MTLLRKTLPWFPRPSDERTRLRSRATNHGPLIALLWLALTGTLSGGCDPDVPSRAPQAPHQETIPSDTGSDGGMAGGRVDAGRATPSDTNDGAVARDGGPSGGGTGAPGGAGGRGGASGASGAGNGQSGAGGGRTTPDSGDGGMTDAARDGGGNASDASEGGAGDKRSATGGGAGGQRGPTSTGGVSGGQNGNTGGTGKGSGTGGSNTSTGGTGTGGASTGGSNTGGTATGGTSTGGTGAHADAGATGGAPDAGSGLADAGAAGRAGTAGHAGNPGNSGSGGTNPSGGTGGGDDSPPHTPAAGELVIDELLIDPNGTDTGKEWIELLNLTDEPVDLSQLVVADDVGEHALSGADTTSPLVLPHGRVVLGQTADLSKNGGAPVDFVYGTKLGLNNDGDRVAICWESCTAHLLDEVRWTMSDPALVGHALQIQRDGSRCPATTTYGTASAGSELNHGTPGAPNPACP